MEIKVYFRGIKFLVEYDSWNPEPATRNYPGCSGGFEMTDVYCEGVKFTEFFKCDDNIWDELETCVDDTLIINADKEMGRQEHWKLINKNKL